MTISVDGANPNDFVVGALGATTVAPDATTTFGVSFNPASAGARSATLHIASNVSGSQNPFDIQLTGTGLLATVWTGPSITFTKADFANSSLAANQDRLTSNVWLTRGNERGIFNRVLEGSSGGNGSLSPRDTEWAYGSTANLGTLVFRPWYQWHGSCPACTVGQPAVLHLISENIYIDIRFTAWTGGGAGGGFSYDRSTPAVVVADGDSDGVPDTTDNCPTIANATQTNTDGDPPATRATPTTTTTAWPTQPTPSRSTPPKTSTPTLTASATTPTPTTTTTASRTSQTGSRSGR